MEIQDFKNYIDDPVKMQEEDFEKIQTLMEKYPFFHTANLLFVKAAHNINHESYNSVISRVSASVPNREMLHELITLKEIKIIPTEKKEAKAEESQTRKDIRERIQKRRDKRTVEKGETLKDNGKIRHESLIKSFFEPIFSKLRKTPIDFNVVIERDIDISSAENIKVDIVDERERKKIEREKRMAEKRRLRAEETTDEDKAKARLEREKKKAEREKRMAEKNQIKAVETTVDDEVRLEREKKKAEREIRMAEKRRIRAEETTDEDREKAKLEREKKKAERQKRMAEKRQLKTEETKDEDQDQASLDNEEKKEEEKRTLEKNHIKENSDDKSVNIEVVSDEIIIESEIPEKIEKFDPKNDKLKAKTDVKHDTDDPYTKIISIPSGDEIKKKESDSSEKIIVETEKQISKEEIKDDAKDLDTPKKTIKKEAKPKVQQDQVIIEEINIDSNVTDSKDEGVVMENIYDKIISSKKPKSSIGKKHTFIEITEDITGLPDEDAKNIEEEIKKDDQIDNTAIEENVISEGEEIVIETEKAEPKKRVTSEKEKSSNVDKKKSEEVEKNPEKIEASKIVITEDKDEKIVIESEKVEPKKQVTSEKEKSSIVEEKKSEVEEKVSKKTKASDIVITEDKVDEIEFIVEDSTETKDVVEVVIENKKEVKIEITDTKEETFELIEKKEQKVSDKGKPKADIKLDKKDEIVKETKAANDVFARIAAFKNKKGKTTKVEDKEETKETTELIQKFVDEKPSIKRNNDESENIDISEESSKVKKPVITELMASIFVNQGKYDQAIDIFEKLILKNPEKKDYFAAKIKETEKLK